DADTFPSAPPGITTSFTSSSEIENPSAPPGITRASTSSSEIENLWPVLKIPNGEVRTMLQDLKFFDISRKDAHAARKVLEAEGEDVLCPVSDAQFRLLCNFLIFPKNKDIEDAIDRWCGHWIYLGLVNCSNEDEIKNKLYLGDVSRNSFSIWYDIEKSAFRIESDWEWTITKNIEDATSVAEQAESAGANGCGTNMGSCATTKKKIKNKMKAKALNSADPHDVPRYKAVAGYFSNKSLFLRRDPQYYSAKPEHLVATQEAVATMTAACRRSSSSTMTLREQVEMLGLRAACVRRGEDSFAESAVKRPEGEEYEPVLGEDQLGE
ncbi:unnamed protein product, partial [Amoebophrya sp. A25]